MMYTINNMSCLLLFHLSQAQAAECRVSK